VSALPNWLKPRLEWMRRRIVTAVLTGIAMALLAAWAGIAFDQWVRNTVDEWMSDPELFDTLSFGPEEYARLPLHWRQALAEVAVRSTSAEMAGVRAITRTLTTQQIRLIDQIAPYVIFDGRGLLVRDNGSPSAHPIPGLVLTDFAALEDLGLLQNVPRGYTSRIALNRPVVWRGTTVALAIESSNRSSPIELHTTGLTEPGTLLIDLLRVRRTSGTSSGLPDKLKGMA